MANLSWSEVQGALREQLQTLLNDPTADQETIDGMCLAIQIESLVASAYNAYQEEGRGFILMRLQGRAALAAIAEIESTYVAATDMSGYPTPDLAEGVRSYDPQCEAVVIIERNNQCRTLRMQLPDELKQRHLQIYAAEETPQGKAAKKERLRQEKELLHLLRDPKSDPYEIDRLYLSKNPQPLIKQGYALYQAQGRGAMILHLSGRKDLANPEKVPFEYVGLEELEVQQPAWCKPSNRDYLRTYDPAMEVFVVLERSGAYYPAALMYRVPGTRALSPDAVATLPSGEIRLADGRRLRYDQDIPDLKGKRWVCPDGMSVVASIKHTEHGPLMHVSLAYQNRDPVLRDVQLVRDAFFPVKAHVMMQLPSQQIKRHNHCFHLHQVPALWGFIEEPGSSMN